MSLPGSRSWNLACLALAGGMLISRALVVLSCSLAMATASPLGREMGSFDNSLKSLRHETDPAAGADAARRAQESILRCLTQVPEVVEEEKDPAVKEKMLAGYKTSMGRLYVALCGIESAFLSKDLPKVAQLMEEVKGLKKSGHAEFVKE